jgi:hypothetical protein
MPHIVRGEWLKKDKDDGRIIRGRWLEKEVKAQKASQKPLPDPAEHGVAVNGPPVGSVWPSSGIMSTTMSSYPLWTTASVGFNPFSDE